MSSSPNEPIETELINPELIDSKLIDAETLAELRELATPDDPHFIGRYFSLFLGTLEKETSALDVAIRAGRVRDAALHAHAARSSCLNSGVRSVAEVCARIEAFRDLERLPDEASALGAEALALSKRVGEEVARLPEVVAHRATATATGTAGAGEGTA